MFNQQQAEALLRDKKARWQDQAEVLLYIRKHRDATWKVWTKHGKEHAGRKFASFADFCEWCGWSHFWAYERTRLAEKAERFKRVRSIDITIELAKKLYEADLATFEDLVLSLELGAAPEQVATILKSPDSSISAQKLLAERARIQSELVAKALARLQNRPEPK